MKRVVDLKSLIIGVLVTVLFFTIVGAKSKNNATFDTITARSINIVNSEGKPVTGLGGGQMEDGLIYTTSMARG